MRVGDNDEWILPGSCQKKHKMSGLVDSLNYSKFDFVDSDDEVRRLKGDTFLRRRGFVRGVWW